jgi:hypothetical protein
MGEISSSQGDEYSPGVLYRRYPGLYLQTDHDRLLKNPYQRNTNVTFMIIFPYSSTYIYTVEIAAYNNLK